MRPQALDAEVNQARLLLAGDDFDGRLQRFGGPLQEFVLIAGVAQGAGSQGADSHHAHGLVLGGHLREHVAGEIHRALADAAGAEDALAEAGDLPGGGQRLARRPADDFSRQHANRVAADIDGGVAWHKRYDRALSSVEVWDASVTDG